MTEQLEHELKHVFAEDAERAPTAVALVEAAHRQVHRRRTRLVLGSGALLAASVALVAVIGGSLLNGPPPGEPTATPPAARPQGNHQPGSRPTGALADGVDAHCVDDYSPSAVTDRAFAFDGTVIAIAPGRTDRQGEGRLDPVAVTFTVNEWFAGGSDATVTVDMIPPIDGQVVEDSTPTYGVGTRLLVSGEPRWGGSPLDDAIAWGCGFTRYYDKTTAASWRAATG